MPGRRNKVADGSALRPALSRVNRLFIFMVRRARGLKDILPRTGARIDQRRVPQFPPRREINFAPFALEVRPQRSARVRPLVPAQSEPAKVFNDRAAKFWPASVAVQIFNSKNKLSATRLSAFLRAPERQRMADMKVTGRRGGDSAAVGNFRFQIGDFRLA
jgi:hypothetical protein